VQLFSFLLWFFHQYWLSIDLVQDNFVSRSVNVFMEAMSGNLDLPDG
jgi:hypothetical protein